LAKQVDQIFLVTIAISIAAILLSEIFAGHAIKYWLGSEYISSILNVRILIAGVLPYSVYVCLRSVLDAAFFKAVNARNAYISLALFLIQFFIGKQLTQSAYLVTMSFLSSVYLLGILTLYQTQMVLKKTTV
jgi:O-antigen/teichoic acid export membrane protein